MNIVLPLRDRVAEAMWNSGGAPVAWDKLHPKKDRSVIEEFLRMADTAIKLVQSEGNKCT